MARPDGPGSTSLRSPEPEVSAHSGDDPSRLEPGRRLQLAAHTINFAKKMVDEEEEQVRKFLAGKSTTQEILRLGIEMMEQALDDMFSDRDAAPREREAVEAEGQQPGPKGSPVSGSPTDRRG